MMKSAARSFTDWPGFMNSALPRIVYRVSSEARLSLISGVLPIAFTMLSRMCMGVLCGADTCGDPIGRPNAPQGLPAAPAAASVQRYLITLFWYNAGWSDPRLILSRNQCSMLG